MSEVAPKDKVGEQSDTRELASILLLLKGLQTGELPQLDSTASEAWQHLRRDWRAVVECPTNLAQQQDLLGRIMQHAGQLSGVAESTAPLLRDTVLRFWSWRGQQQLLEQLQPSLRVSRPQLTAQSPVTPGVVIQTGWAFLCDAYGALPAKTKLGLVLKNPPAPVPPNTKVATRSVEQLAEIFQGNMIWRLRQVLQQLDIQQRFGSLAQIERSLATEFSATDRAVFASLEMHLGKQLWWTNHRLGQHMGEARSSLELALVALQCVVSHESGKVIIKTPSHKQLQFTVSEFRVLEHYLQLLALRWQAKHRQEIRQQRRRTLIKRAIILGLVGVAGVAALSAYRSGILDSTALVPKPDQTTETGELPLAAPPVSEGVDDGVSLTATPLPLPPETVATPDITPSQQDQWDAYVAAHPELAQYLHKLAAAKPIREFMTTQADAVDGIQGCRINCVFQPPLPSSPQYSAYQEFVVALDRQLTATNVVWETKVAATAPTQEFVYWYRAGRQMQLQVTAQNGVVEVQVSEFKLASDQQDPITGEQLFMTAAGEPNPPTVSVYQGSRKQIMVRYLFHTKTGVLEGYSPTGDLISSATYEVGQTAYAMVGFEDTAFVGMVFDPADSGQTQVKFIGSQ